MGGTRKRSDRIISFVLAAALVLGLLAFTGGTALAGPTYKWLPMTSPISTSYTCVTVLDPYNAWAGTNSGKIIHWNGSAWAEQTGPGGSALIEGMDALSADDVWAVRADGSVLHYNGTYWAVPYLTPSPIALNDISAVSANNVWAVGDNGTVVRYNGSGWQLQTFGTDDFYTVDAFASNCIWFGGDNSAMYYSNGSSTFKRTIPDLHQVTGISSVAPDDIWAVGANGVAIHYNGSNWVPVSTGLSGSLNEVVALDSRNAVAVGANGAIFQYNGSTWVAEGSGVVQNIYGIDKANGGQLCAVGALNTLLAGVPDKFPTWYLAEGTTAWGFSTYITIENPNPFQLHADITYMTGSGSVDGGSVLLPSRSQAVIEPSNVVGNQDFSTLVTCREGLTIAVDRTMAWTGQGAPSEEGHCSIGVAYPNTTWYLPEGSSAWGFECWLLIQNPNAWPANCQVTYMVENEAPQTFNKLVPGNSRASFNMADDIGQKDASIKVVSDVPVIPERSMYRNSRREGHDSIGTVAPAVDSYLAEGCTGFGFTTYVLVQNPNSSPVDVNVTYMTGASPVAVPKFQMPANSRKTINVNTSTPLPDPNFSTSVHGSRPIIAERAMYWNKGSGEACHDSIGMSMAHANFYLPDGQTSNGRETWTLVQNPNGSNVQVKISYLLPGGAGNVAWTETIPANSRRSFNMADKGISGRAAVMVESQTAGKKIIVERSMYWNNRGAGTDTVGAFSD